MLNEIMTNNIFLTGGTGFFGKNLLARINIINSSNEKKIYLKILSRDPQNIISKYPKLINENYMSFIEGEIRNFKLPETGTFDYVIHGATEASAKLELENPREMYSVIVEGTRNLLEQITGKADRLLFISSGGVYGNQPSGLTHIPEDFPCNPVSAYGKGKLEAEKLCLNSGISTSIARCFAFVGSYLPLDTHFAIGNFILNGLRNEPIIIKGDGTSIRSYMYSSDLVEWLLSILIDGEDGEVYNVGSEEAISIAELARLVNECFDNMLKVEILGKTMPGASDRYIPSTQKAQKELNLKLPTDLKSAIEKTIEWHLNHQ